MNIKDEQQMAEHFSQPGPMDRIRQKRKGERAYTNDEIARFEGVRAELRAFDDPAQIDRMEKAVAVLRGGAQCAVPGADYQHGYADGVEWATVHGQSSWRPIETAPKDGSEILILTSVGATQARFAPGEWHNYPEGREYSGPAWVCCDDQWNIEIEDCGQDGMHHGIASGWMPLPGSALAIKETCFDCGAREPCDDECPNHVEPTPVTEGERQKLPQFVIRRNDDGSIDEVVGEVRFVHIEQMSNDSWFVAFDTPDGAQQRFWMGSKNRKSEVVFRHDETIPAALTAARDTEGKVTPKDHSVPVLIEALWRCGCPIAGNMTIGECAETEQCGCSIRAQRLKGAMGDDHCSVSSTQRGKE